MHGSRHTVLTAAAGALLLLVLQAWPAALPRLGFLRPAFAQGAVWQLLTSQFVHLDWHHALLNALAWGLSVLAWRPWVGLWALLLAFGGGLAGVALQLALDHEAGYYAGLSGALHGLWAGCALAWLVQAARSARGERLSRLPPGLQGVLALGVLGLLVLKLVLENQAAPAAHGLPVYLPAHWAGLAGGLLAIGLALAGRRVAAPQHGP